MPTTNSTPDSTGRIGVVVPVLDARAYLPACLGALRDAAASVAPRAEVRIVVVDNGSVDGSAEFVAENFPSIRLARLPSVTISALRNHGAQLAGGDVYVFIDADCVVVDDYFARLLDVLEDPSIDATGCAYALPDRPHWIERSWHALHRPDEDGPVNYINSGNLACRKVAFAAVGGFDETLATGEDTEFCQRLRRAGFTIEQRRSVAAVHLGNPKSLAAFVRKQAWHARGMFGTFRNDALDKPLILTVVHLAAMVAALPLLLLLGAGGKGILAAIGLLLAAPAAAVLYRMVDNRRFGTPVRGLFLYFLYLTARAVVLLGLMAPRGARKRPRESLVRTSGEP